VARLEVADARAAFIVGAKAELWATLASLDADPALLAQLLEKA